MQRVLAACEPLGALVPGPRPLEGKSFYLDEVKSQTSGFLTKLITRLGGKVESFLYKDVNVVITGNKDALSDIKASSRKVKGHDSHEHRGSGNDAAQRPRAPVCGSRGKALLEKAIRNNEQSRGGVLSNAARYWGAKVVSVDQFMKVVEKLSSHRSTHTYRRKEEKNSSEFPTVHVIKAGSLKVGFVKVEDSSRKYRPLHVQSLDFPMLSYTRRFSPFENPTPVHSGKTKEGELSKDKFRKSKEPISSGDKPVLSPKTCPKKKSLGYCECCQVKYSDQDEHLRSDLHRRFAEDVNNYTVVDRLVAAMDKALLGCEARRVDALMTRLSSSYVAPPPETEQQCKGETETYPTNQESGPADAVDIQQERVCQSKVLLQEPGVDESKVTEGKLNTTSNDKTRVPSPHPQKDFILDTQPLENDPPSPEVISDDYEARTQLVELPLRPLPHLETSQNKERSSSAHLKSPDQDTASDLPPCARATEGEQIPPVDAPSGPQAFHSLPPGSLTMNMSDGVNPKKRSRSFTLTPKVSKVRRTNLRSDPTNQSSGVNVCFDRVEKRIGETTAVTEHTLEAAEPRPDPNSPLGTVDPPEDRLSFPNDRQPVPAPQNPGNAARDVSSELGPPQLYPFFNDDVYQNNPPYLDPPKLAPSAPFSSINQASSTSLLSQSFSSVCIESALVPETFSPASSESDWDSGLLSRLAPPVHLQSKGGRCELDLGLLLQSSCGGMQDGSYASRLCSVLQPGMSSAHGGCGDQKAVYRPIETMDRRIVQSLGV